MAQTEANLLSELSPLVAQLLKECIETAQTAYGQDLKSIILFGSAAEGRLRATTDVNIILLLTRLVQRAADLMRKPLRVARAAISSEPPMFLLPTRAQNRRRRAHQNEPCIGSPRNRSTCRPAHREALRRRGTESRVSQGDIITPKIASSGRTLGRSGYRAKRKNSPLSEPCS